MAMTKHLEDALKVITKKFPIEIFTPEDLYGLPFNRPSWICNRLVEEEKLHNKTSVDHSGSFPRVIYKYQIKQ